MVDFTTSQTELVVPAAVVGQSHVALDQGMVVIGSKKNIETGSKVEGII